jgi:dihydroorotate dehydrogenase (fumarate)
MADLKTNYLGIELKNPLVASASALSKKMENIVKMEDAGIGGVVLYSLFEEEIVQESRALDYYLTRGTESFAEALTYFPDFSNYNVGPEKYLEHIRKLKEKVNIPIIASLNGISSGGWIKYAKLIEQAGADALELNIYFVPTDLDVESTELEKVYLDLVRDIKKDVNIPLSVKLSPFFTSLPNEAEKLVKAGTNGLVLFNRFYQPDLDIENLRVEPTLRLSTSSDLLLPLRWTAILYKKINADIALSSGVHSGKDIVKAVMAGASVVMSASELIKNGIDSAKAMLLEFSNWMDVHEYQSVESLRGVLSQRSVSHPAAFERANYMKSLTLFDDNM